MSHGLKGALFLIMALLILQPGPVISKTNKAPYNVAHSILPYKGRDFSFGRAKYTLVVSIDGLPYQLLKFAFNNGFEMPNLRSLVRGGFFRPMQSTFPTMTWSAHTSMITGQYPRYHGVLGNHWLENREKYTAPFEEKEVDQKRRSKTYALFDLMNRAGRSSAALNWPTTQGSQVIRYNFPETMRSSSLPPALMSKSLKKLASELYYSNFRSKARWPSKSYLKSHQLDRFIGKISHKEMIEVDMLVRDLTVRLIRPPSTFWSKQNIPGLILTHFLITDSWHHRYGTNPLVLRWGLELVDKFIGDIIKAYRAAGVFEQTAVFIVSDHGFLNATHKVDLYNFLRKYGYRKKRSLDEKEIQKQPVTVITNGHSAFIYMQPGVDQKKFIRRVRANRQRLCLGGIFQSNEFLNLGLPIPHGRARYSSKDAPDLVLLSEPHCYFTLSRNRLTLIRLGNNYQVGTHGYLPDHPEMMSFMIGHGPGVKKSNSRKKTYIVDLAPTVAHLLGLSWPSTWPASNEAFRHDGRILFDALENLTGPALKKK